MNFNAASITSESAMRHGALPVQVTRGEASFASLLSGQAPTQDVQETLREAAEQMVSTVFVTPILGAMRENSMATGPFAPNAAEKRFGPLLDQQFADRIVKGANFSLVDMIVQRYLPQQSQQQSPLDSTQQPVLERTFA